MYSNDRCKRQTTILYATAPYLGWSCWRGSDLSFWVFENGPSCWLGSPHEGRLTGPGWCSLSPPPSPRGRKSGWWCWLPEWIVACVPPASRDLNRDKVQQSRLIYWIDAIINTVLVIRVKKQSCKCVPKEETFVKMLKNNHVPLDGAMIMWDGGYLPKFAGERHAGCLLY